MRKTLLIITAVMLVIGCSKPINDETLIDVDGLKYHPETKELYSGDVFKNYLGGKTEYEGSYKNGKQDGKWTYWWENGQKMMEGNWKNGKPWDGKKILWHQNGQKQSELTIKDGELDGKGTSWYENGQKKEEATYKDGMPDGLWTYWYENGQKWYEATWKDGKQIGKTKWY